MHRIKNIEKTCESHPAQWEGETEDGERFYIRYRHGHLAAAVAGTVDEAVDIATGLQKSSEGNAIGIQVDPSETDGEMTEVEMLTHLVGWLEVPG